VKLVILPAALDELRDGAAFYAERAGSDLGLAFVGEFERVVEILLENPKLGAVFRGRRRRHSLRRFPYSVIYQETPEELRIVAVAHQRRRPIYWSRRR
jgi:plasmid stabilization system protein ParE